MIVSGFDPEFGSKSAHDHGWERNSAPKVSTTERDRTGGVRSQQPLKIQKSVRSQQPLKIQKSVRSQKPLNVETEVSRPARWRARGS
jgi:hypothetical protein